MDYAVMVWVCIIVVFMLLIGIFVANGGLVWTDKIEQLEQAQIRVIPKDYKMKY